LVFLGQKSKLLTFLGACAVAYLGVLFCVGGWNGGMDVKMVLRGQWRPLTGYFNGYGYS
jgi:hypothetical protein